MSGRATDRLSIPVELWQRPQMVDALRGRDVAGIFQLVRQYAGASQTRLAIACGLTQGKVSAIMSGDRLVTALDVFERIAYGLQMPDTARVALGLAPRDIPAHVQDQPARPIPRLDRDGRTGDPFSPEPPNVGVLDQGEDQDPLRRRTFARLAGASLFGAVLADTPAVNDLPAVERLAAALARYTSGEADCAEPAVLDASSLAKDVATAKRHYQACRYSDVIRDLPALLFRLHAAGEVLEGDARLKVHALSAEAHHAAASILLKLDNEGLAWLAADRSMQAAHRSEDPLLIGSSARIVTHALMNGGHTGAATRTASTLAARLDSDVSAHTPESLSVYGSLLLRGAIAAAHRSDRHEAATLLAEADDAASRVGGDHNYHWTAFGPTNVLLHRVNIAVTMGDAGTAIDQARKVDLDNVPITERKASLLIDTSRAFAQWGKYDKAFYILRAAEQLAREEIRTRPSVHRLVRGLLSTAPQSVTPQIRQFAEQIGVAR